MRWSIQDEDGAPAPDVYWKVGAGGAGLDGKGGSVAPPIDRALDVLELTFVLVRELTTAAPVAIPETRQVAASLQLIAGGFSSEWIELAPVPLTVPTIPEGRHYSCRISGGRSAVLVDEATEPVATLDLASR